MRRLTTGSEVTPYSFPPLSSPRGQRLFYIVQLKDSVELKIEQAYGRKKISPT